MQARGAYGLVVRGLRDATGLMPAPSAWPPVTLEQDVGVAPPERHALDEERATVVITETMVAELDRVARTATLVTDAPWSDGALVHPFLAAPGMIFAWWDGRESLHGGAFVASDGRAWAVLADKGFGKSTTLAHLAASGVTVIADDLVVVDAGGVLAGPRCVDLRPDAAAALDLHDLPTDARQTKPRMTLGPVAPCTPLAGVIHLAWDDHVALVEVPPRARLPRLAPHRSVGLMRDPSALLDLVALPTYELRRPRDLASLAPAADLLRALES